jgi:peptidoglycan hydrolase CwlO-like protein
MAVLAGICTPTSLATTSHTPHVTVDPRREALMSQLQSLSGPRNAARDRLLAAERQLAVAQARLVAARSRLTSLNNALLSLSRHISDDEHVLGTARAQLAALVRSTYEVAGSDGFAAAILSSASFTEVVDRYRGAEHVTDQVHRLQDTVVSREAALLQERGDLQARFAEAQGIEDQLSEDDNRMIALVAQRDIDFQAIDGPQRKLAKEIAELDQAVFPPSDGLPGTGGCGNHFAFGQCTYYVATRRCVPWFGNAREWLSRAAAYGFSTGRNPRAGAIAVWRPGESGASPAGHVGYVESVGPEDGIPAGFFKVSEMNWGGWDRVDYRVVSDDSVMGFVYTATEAATR